MTEQQKIEALIGLLPRKRSRQYYSEQLDIDLDEVERLIRKIRNNKDDVDAELNIEGSSEDINYEKGTKRVNYKSSKPLSPEELKVLAGVDDLTTYISRSWLKSSDNNTFWDYSIDVRYRISDFYTGKEFQDKLKDLFPKSIARYAAPKVKATDKVLMIYIGDDHCGLILKDSQYGNEHSEEIYRGRLDQIYTEVLRLDTIFSKVYLVSLGDELDGYNGFTTRGGHHLGSGSNKDQFDIYVNSRREFYDKLFSSGVSEKFVVINQNNSNHSGKGLSYMANRALEIYLECRFENVFVVQTDKLIQVIEVGNHIFGFVHGKDESHQKNPLPLNLDAKADAYLFEFYDKQGYSPSKHWISTVKADIHKLNLNMGKHGRYVNIPSISSGSNWIEANFGNSQPGALLEVVNPNSKNITSIPIWF